MFTNEEYWQTFCAWIKKQGKHQAFQIMTAYIEQNFEHFMQFVENYKLIEDRRKEDDNITPPKP